MTDEVVDTITGFVGKVVAHTEFMNGCHQYLVQAKSKESGKQGECNWIDDQQLELVIAAKPAATPKPRGGPSVHPAPSQRR